MSHFEQRLEKDLTQIRSDVYNLGASVADALENAVDALLTENRELAYLTIIGDNPINRESENLDLACHHFIARHLPSAGHLRFISSVMRMVILLERMGDYAVNISRVAANLDRPLSGAFRAELKSMADDALQMFRQALSAFDQQDQSLAKGTMGYAEQVDRDFSLAYSQLIEHEESDLSIEDLFGRLVAISQLERVSDQAKNLCEMVVFSVTGEMKSRRPMHILFLGRSDSGPTQLAVGIGRKYFSGRGVFDSAGLEPAEKTDMRFLEFMDEHGVDSSGLDPSAISWPAEDWDKYDVILALEGRVDDYIDSIPFHTVAFDWAPADDDLDPGDWYRYLQQRLRELVEILRGSEEENKV